jgi:hypothetical protein
MHLAMVPKTHLLLAKYEMEGSHVSQIPSAENLIQLSISELDFSQ